MSALDDIAAAAAALNALATQEAAQKAAIDASVAAALKAISANAKSVYLDQVAGLDTNDGLTPQTAVKTLNAATALVGAGQFGQVNMMSDVLLTQQLDLVNSSLRVASYLGNRHTLTIDPAACGTAPGAPNAAISCDNLLGQLAFYGIDLHLGALPAICQGTIKAEGFAVFQSMTVTIDPNCQACVFTPPATNGALLISSVAFPANIPGKLIYGTPAGGNPNSFALRTNITSA